MARIRKLTRGRAWVARLSGLLVLAAIVALVVAVVPVLATHEGPLIPPASAGGVTPTEVTLGGQSGDCLAVDAEGNFELRIENPQPGASVSANHGVFDVTFTIIDVYNINDLASGVKGEAFSWSLDAAGTDMVVKGGANSAHYDYLDATHGGTGAVSSDSDNHATLQNKKRLHSVSHATVCYDVVATISGTVWHDNDQDGTQDNPPGTPPANIDPDEPEELGLGGWTVRAYDSSGTEVASTDSNDPDGTAADGSYSFPGLPIGETYTVCQEDPNGGQWSQNAGTVTPNVCGINDPLGLPDEEPAGHVIDLQGNATANFGNFITEDGGCGDTFGPVGHEITLPDDNGQANSLCTKPDAEWVVETYTRANGEEVHDFHPVGGFEEGEEADVTEVHVFSLDLEKEQETGRTLVYDDGEGEAEAALCEIDPTTGGVLDPDKVGDALDPTGGPDGGPDTTCIITFTKNSDNTTTFFLYSKIDGRRLY